MCYPLRCMNSLSIKVLVEQMSLLGSSDGDLQKVATVYVGRIGEYRVYAPSRASGSTLEWVGNLCVRTQAPDGRGEIDAPNYLAEQVISLVKQQLEVDSEPEPEGKRILKSAGQAVWETAKDLLVRYAVGMSKPGP